MTWKSKTEKMRSLYEQSRLYQHCLSLTVMGSWCLPLSNCQKIIWLSLNLKLWWLPYGLNQVYLLGFASQNEGIAESARSKVKDGKWWFHYELVTKGTAENEVPASSSKQYQGQKHN